MEQNLNTPQPGQSTREAPESDKPWDEGSELYRSGLQRAIQRFPERSTVGRRRGSSLARDEHWM